jgi:predicted HTH domain antitoxin
MSLTIRLDLPETLEKKFRAESTNLDAEVRDAYALELFRQGRLSHYELSQALGLDRFETDGYLKRHNVHEGSLTLEDLEEQRKNSEHLMGRMGGK